MQRAEVMPQAQRAHRDFVDGPYRPVDIDVFSDTESIV